MPRLLAPILTPAVAMFGVALLVACGQRGPLYLPSQGVPASQRPPAQLSAVKKPAADAPAALPAAAATAAPPVAASSAPPVRRPASQP